MSNFNKKKSKKTSKKKSSGKKRINKKGGSEYFDYIVGEKKEKHSGFGYDDIFKIRVASNDMVIQDALKKDYLFEKHLTMQISQYIKPGDVGLDLGTNIGCVTIPLSRMVGDNGRIHSFEPFPKTQEYLEHNIKTNNLNNVTLHKAAAGHTIMKTTLSGEIANLKKTDNKKNNSKKNNSKKNSKKVVKIKNMDFRIDSKDIKSKENTNYGGVQLGKGGPIVNMITVDSLSLPVVNFSKIDVEGAESIALYGARETITRCKPIIAFEYNWQKLSEDYVKELNIPPSVYRFDFVKFCRTLGYDKLVWSDEDYILFPKDTQRVNNDPKISWEQVDTIQGLNEFDISGYTLYKYVRPKWND
jgi:hypothetical protein